MTFSVAVRRLARERGLKLAQVERLAGFAKDGELSIRLKSDYPRYATMQRIAAALNMKVWEILKYAEEQVK